MLVVSQGPVGPPPEDAPPPPATPPGEGAAGWEVTPEVEKGAIPPAPEGAPASGPASWEIEQQPEAPTPGPPADLPPPEYAPPPGYAAPPVATATPRRMGPIIAAVVIVALVVVAVVGYGIAGYAFASSRIDSAKSKYNTVIGHQNAITDAFNSFDSKVASVNLTSATAAQLKQNRTAYDQLVSQSQAAQPTISTDDTTLAAAQASLNDNSWLTVFSRSSLDQVSTKIGHERNALASAKTITGDLVQLGTFYQSFYDSLIDLDTVSTKAGAGDFAGAKTALTPLTTDLGKALQLSTAPGLPPEMKQFVTDFQTTAVDFGKLLDATIAGNASAIQAEVKAVDADSTKLGTYDFDKMSTAIKSFYQPLIDNFNSEVSKANNS